MEFALLGILAVVALWAKKHAENATGTQNPLLKSGAGSIQKASYNPGAVAAGGAAIGAGTVLSGAGAGAKAIGGDIGKVAGGVVAVVGGAIVGGAVGSAIDDALFGEGTSKVRHDIAIGAGAVLGAASVALYMGWLSGPFYPIVAIVAIATYCFTIVFIDADQTTNGPKRCEAALKKTRDGLVDNCFQHLRAQPDLAMKSNTELMRYVYPFVDGYVDWLDRNAFQVWMHKGGILTGSTLKDHAVYGYIRGFFASDSWPDQLPTIPGYSEHGMRGGFDGLVYFNSYGGSEKDTTDGRGLLADGTFDLARRFVERFVPREQWITEERLFAAPPGAAGAVYHGAENVGNVKNER